MKIRPTHVFLAPALLAVPAAQATLLDVYESPDLTSTYGQIETIATAESGASHYNYFSFSGHPSGVNVSPYTSNVWVHENTLTGEFSFGFIFHQDNTPNDANSADFRFRIVDSDSNVYVSRSDDSGEATEDPASPGTFSGQFNYNRNTDGIMVSGITGTDWTIIIDSVDFGDVTDWYAASGETADFSDDLALILGNEYRITLADNDVSDADVDGDGTISVTVTEPSSMLIFASGLLGLAIARRRLDR
ncbi:MAG: PEP-CTERM sorting domain-containing protein [Ketobacteraceae bacterium]|nr:PEP-CTERM sorting domain-containing protein [Ketobacteraceae bacterium]